MVDIFLELFRHVLLQRDNPEQSRNRVPGQHDSDRVTHAMCRFLSNVAAIKRPFRQRFFMIKTRVGSGCLKCREWRPLNG